MSDTMVRSNLKLLINQRNADRIRAGQPELTIRQLALDAGVPPSVVSGLTSGRAQQVHFRTIDRLCKALACTPGDLLVYTPDENS
jgi:putative transcriptional regulator